MLLLAFVSLGGFVVFGIFLVATATACVRRIGRSSVGSVDTWYDEERAERIEEYVTEV
jgi:hypothetical protein